MPIFLVTTVNPSGSHVTAEIEAEHYFTDDEWVTFWTSDGFGIPEPIARFEHAAIVRIEKN